MEPGGAGGFLQRHSVDVGVRVEGDPNVQLIRIPGGLGIAYRHSSSLAVYYAWTGTTSPSAGTEWKTVLVDPRPSTGSLGLVLMPDNGPGILYHTVVPDGLQFAQLQP